MESIYIVDDENIVRRTLKRTLNNLGYNTSSFNNTTEALEALTKNIPNLIIMDTEMEDGLWSYEACKVARELYGNTFGIIGMSGNDFEQRWMESGADTFLKKPFKLQEFIDTVKTTLEKY